MRGQEMSGTSLNAMLYIISALFDLYILILIIRLVLAAMRADYYNPITQLIVRCTTFIVKPLKKILPDIKNFEIATFVLIIVLEIVKYFLLMLISFGLPNFFGLFILASGDAIRLALQMWSFAILIQAIMSWLQPNSPIIPILDQLTSPILRPLKRIVPPIAGIDITPIPALIILQLLIIVVAYPLKAWGLGLANWI
jgi:YggT family protein